LKNQQLSGRSLTALSLMIFFIADIQGGIGPILSIYLRSNLGWDTSQVVSRSRPQALLGYYFKFPAE